MDALRRNIRRQQLDAQLARFVDLSKMPTPRGGWIRAVREALGMSLDQFARRLGVASASTAFQLEHAEMNGSITVKRMRAAADVLGCDLIVALVPRVPLQLVAEEQAMRKAGERLARLSHTMAMEAQQVDKFEKETLLKKGASDILDRGGVYLWD